MKLDFYFNSGGISMSYMTELFTTSLFGMFSEKRKYKEKKRKKRT